MNEMKDTTANLATVIGSGAAVMDWNTYLTFGLIVTGIVLNLVRIYEIKHRK